jgi:hypothetical protein
VVWTLALLNLKIVDVISALSALVKIGSLSSEEQHGLLGSVLRLRGMLRSRYDTAPGKPLTGKFDLDREESESMYLRSALHVVKD